VTGVETRCDTEWASGVACSIPDDAVVTAFHEAGHVAVRLALGMSFRYVTVRASGCRGRVVVRSRMRPDWEVICSAAGGPAAQGLYLERLGCCVDCVSASVSFNGCEDDIRQAGLADVRDVLEPAWSRVTELAEALLAAGTLTGAQCKTLWTSVSSALAEAGHRVAT
jgi:hypothetical protein